MLRRWRDGEGVVSDLIPGTSSGGRGRGHLPDDLEALIREVLRTRYLTRQKRSIDSGEEAINQRTLLMAAYRGPTERRRLFERELV